MNSRVPSEIHLDVGPRSRIKIHKSDDETVIMRLFLSNDVDEWVSTSNWFHLTLSNAQKLGRILTRYGEENANLAVPAAIDSDR